MTGDNKKGRCGVRSASAALQHHQRAGGFPLDSRTCAFSSILAPRPTGGFLPCSQHQRRVSSRRRSAQPGWDAVGLASRDAGAGFNWPGGVGAWPMRRGLSITPADEAGWGCRRRRSCRAIAGLTGTRYGITT